MIMARVNYEEEQITEFLELAQEVGMSRAMRELGYPKSPYTAHKWADQRGVDVTKDARMRAASLSKYLMEDMDEIQVVQAGIERVLEELMANTDLSPDEHYKLAQALNKHVTTKQLLLGRVTSRTEQIQKDSVQAEIDSLMAEFEGSGEYNPPAENDVQTVHEPAARDSNQTN